MTNTDERALKVKFYRTPIGNEPVKEWLQEQTKEVRRIIGEDIRTAQKVWPMGAPLIKPLEHKIWEIRSRIPSGTVRIIFTVRSEHIVLLHAFMKKTQKTPKQELEIARKRLKEWVD
jgi:phage-related protein